MVITSRHAPRGVKKGIVMPTPISNNLKNHGMFFFILVTRPQPTQFQSHKKSAQNSRGGVKQAKHACRKTDPFFFNRKGGQLNRTHQMVTSS